ncbi:PIN domain-containing protein [Oceanobacillus halotolerans]|uniref:PIN domain-containing protein n=1 Tax=Oceanobacillus halotolerans TaxID=2663380 RepID=UPI0013DBF9BD|nr:PIN domain-containing protein [Oceanobacillus halotolerans]
MQGEEQIFRGISEAAQGVRPIIPDTNFFISSLDVLKRLPAHLIIVSQVVFRELDGLKKSDDSSSEEEREVAYRARQALSFIDEAKLKMEPVPKASVLRELQMDGSNDEKIVATCIVVQKRENMKPLFVTYDRGARLAARSANVPTYELPTKNQPDWKLQSNKTSSQPGTVQLEKGKTGMANRSKTKRPIKVRAPKLKIPVGKLIGSSVVGIIIFIFIAGIIGQQEDEEEKKDAMSDFEFPFDNIEVELTNMQENESSFRLEYEAVNLNDSEIIFGYLDLSEELEEIEAKNTDDPSIKLANEKTLIGMKENNGQLILRYKDDTVEYPAGRRELLPNQVETITIMGQQPLENLASITALMYDPASDEVREWVFEL